MANFGETRQHRDEREARQRLLYPELEFADERTIFEIDRRRRLAGQPPTGPGEDAERVYANDPVLEQRAQAREQREFQEFVRERATRPLDGGAEPEPVGGFSRRATVRGGDARERMTRAFDRGRTPTLPESLPESERRLREPVGGFSRRRGRAATEIVTTTRSPRFGRSERDGASPADIFRRVVPQGVRDVAGGAVQTFIEDIGRPVGAVGGVLTGEDPLDSIIGFAQGWMEPGAVNWENIGFVRQLPEESEARRIASEVARVAFDPVTWGTVAVTGPGALARSGAPKIIKGLLEPLIPGGARARLAAETAFGSAMVLGTEEATERGANPVVALGVGVLAGMGSLTAIRAAPRVGRAAQRVVEATEPALRRVVPALGVEDVSRLTPKERAARGLPEAGRATEAAPPVGPLAAPAGLPRGPFENARDKLLKLLREEESIARVGKHEREVHEGRLGQVARMENVVERAAAEGVTPEEFSRTLREAARTGPLRKTFAEPLALDPTERAALSTEFIRQRRAGEIGSYELLRAEIRLDNLIEEGGRRLPKGDRELLGKLMGDEVVEALERRPRTAAGRFAEEAKELRETQRLNERALARQLKTTRAAEQKANRLQWEQAELRDLARATDPREIPVQLPGKLEQARIRSLGAFNRADEQEISAANQWIERQAEQRAAREARAQQKLLDDAEIRDIMDTPDPRVLPEQRSPRLEDARLRAIAAFDRADAVEIARLRRESTEALARQQRTLQRSEQQAIERERAARERFENKHSEMNDEQLTRRALGLLAESNPELARELGAAVDSWLTTNRILLDAVGEDASRIVAAATAALSGDVADSFVTSALRRTALLGGVLRQMGVADDVVRKVVDDLLQAEMKAHYGTVPERVTALVKKTRGVPYEESWGGLDTAVQRFKNTMFGIDLGIFGVQGLAAVTRGGVPMLAGMVNRLLTVLNIPVAAPVHANLALSRRLQFMLDGVSHYSSQGVSASPVRTQAGSMLQYLGPPGKFIDRMVWEPIAETLNRWQFGHVMGYLRDLNHEGNLAMLHLLGRDITDVLVRQQSARAANAIGSFANTALTTRRAGVERRLLTSAPMTRAQIQWMTDTARAFVPGKATTEERILAALTIVSFGGSILAVGKLLHDNLGMGEFEFDPSKPGFGRLQLRNGWNINLFPQISVVRALARSVRELTEGDPQEAVRAWAKFWLGRTSFVGRAAGALAGYGYQAGVGWRLGDLPQKDRLLSVVPIPPMVQHVATEGFDPFSGALEELGISTFRESGLGMAQRVSKQETGTPYLEMERDERDAFERAHPEIKERMDADARERGGPFAEALDVYEETERQQLGNDDLLKRWRDGEPDGINAEEWKRRRRSALDQQVGALAQVFKDFGDREPDPTKPEELYWAKIREHTDAQEKVDWDAVDDWRTTLSADENELIDRRTGLRATPTEKEYRDVGRSLRDSGFFDIRDKVWERVAEREELGAFASIDEFEADVRRRVIARLAERGVSGGAADEIARDIFQKIPAVSVWSQISNDVEELWVTANPALADQALLWGYLRSPRKAELGAIIQNQRQPVAAP